MQFSSKLVEEAVNQFSRLPGIGKKTALRLVLHLLKSDLSNSRALSQSIVSLRENIKYCKHCHYISDESVCSICASHRRDRSLICVVESTPDVMAIENTAQYQGLYHVLGGVISPLDGIGPDELHIDSLISRLQGQEKEPVKEVILALSSTMEGDTTAFYLSKKLKPFGVKVSSIARGIPIGGELEFTDEVTLGRSIVSRVIFDIG